MSRKAKFVGLALTSVILSGVTNAQEAEAKRWTQWASQAVSGIRQIQQFHNSHSGGGESPSQPQSSYEPPSGSPGSNYYNISPETMRNPLHHQEAPQPAYTPPPEPTYSPSYSSRSAYHTGTGAPDNPSARMPNYMQAHAKIHAHVAPTKRIEHAPEKASVVAVKKESPATENVSKPETITPATGFDTSWVTHSVDRIESRLRAPQG